MSAPAINNICFVANFNKTEFFDRIAVRLRNKGCEIFWITVNRRLHDFLRARYPEKQILLINKTYIERPAEAIEDFKLQGLVFGDRVLRHMQTEGIKYLTNIQRPLYDFIATNHIGHIFGEITWAHEILALRLANRRKELRCRYLNPATIRIPNGRFAFFADEYQSVMVEKPEDKSDSAASSVIKLEKPDYLKLNDHLLKKSRSLGARVAKTKRFFTRENIDSLDPTLIDSDWLRLRIRLREEWNKETYRFVKTCTLDKFADKPYTLVTLHKQPEASIDVLGRYYDDQFQNIFNIRRFLPADWAVLVKEHTNAIGDRACGFYRNLQKIPGIFILNERTDSHEAIRRSSLVVTVSGTVAYEAALLEKTAFTLVPTFFNRLPFCLHVTWEDFRRAGSVRELIDRAKEGDENFARYLLQNSFAGIISDPISNPACMKEENITKVSEAFFEITGNKRRNYRVIFAEAGVSV
ncbi:putative Capsule polysaccharide biosynthesis protein [Candidatus Zixiibacteriota bacterium]|nr:putative Capsule polysaccharide biosynthesis protein [candidate division Zixibacteria bacterium]